jgi:tRNA(Ile)-lysidine synthetase-like protein
VGHVEHGLRDEAKDDALHVGELCKKFGLPTSSCSLDAAGHAAGTGQGLEMAARELRWAWLKSEAANIGAGWIATGHTIEDHTETAFIRLARGGGAGCLSGLPATQPPRWSPLIECRREELRAYLRQSEIEWREDQTNEQGFTARNRWRSLLAGFREEAPSLDRHLWETHRQVAALADLRDAAVASWKPGRWSIMEGRHIFLSLYWKPSDLEWALEAAFKEMGRPRDAAHIFNLSAWAAKVLSRPIKRVWRWGNWSLAPHSEGGVLQIDSADSNYRATIE